MSTIASLGTLKIPSGQTKSNIIGSRSIGFVEGLCIYPPTSLSGTVTVRVAHTPPSVAQDADFRDLESGGSVVTLTAGQALTLSEVSFMSMRLETSLAPGSDEDYPVTGQEYP